MKPSLRSLCLSAFVLFGAALSACRTHPVFSATGAEAAADTSAGLRYFLGRDVLVIDADVTYKRTKTWLADSTCKAGDLKTTWQWTQWKVAPLVAADRSRQFRLGVVPGSTAAKSLNVTVSDIGLLSALNYTAKDQTGEIIGNVLKGIAGIAGTALGFGQAAGVKETATDEGCFKRERPAAAKTLDSLIVAKSAELDSTHEARIRMLKRATTAQTIGQLLQLRMADSILAQREALLSADVVTARGKRASALATYLKGKGIFSSDTTMRLQYGVDVGLLPTDWNGKTFTNAQSVVTGDALKLLDNARLFIVARDIPSRLTARTAPLGSAIGCTDAANGCARIYYRVPRQRLLELYTPASDDNTADMVLRERTVAVLVSSADSAVSVAFDAKPFAEAGFKLGFGRTGNVTTLDQTSSSSLTAATAAVTTAITNARSEFVSGIKSAQDAQTSLQAISQSKANARLQELKTQKDLIDAEVALSGTKASQDLLLQKRQIDAEIELLKSQQALTNAQTDATRTSDTAELRDQIERLKIEIELLKQQLELEKIKAAKPQ